MHSSGGVGMVSFDDLAPRAAGRSVGAEAFFQTIRTYRSSFSYALTFTFAVLAAAGLVRPEQSGAFQPIHIAITA